MNEDGSNKRHVAVKVLKPRNDRDNQARARWKRETRCLEYLNEEGIRNIPALIDSVEYNDTYYIITKFIKDSISLDHWLVRRGNDLTTRDVLDIALPIAKTLYSIHILGIVHRDIKPANIVVKYDEHDNITHAYLCDFDAAFMKDGTNGLNPFSYHYMAPEIAREIKGVSNNNSGRLSWSSSCDVWSFGVTLHEIITLKKPFATNILVDISFKDDILKDVIDTKVNDIFSTKRNESVEHLRTLRYEQWERLNELIIRKILRRKKPKKRLTTNNLYRELRVIANLVDRTRYKNYVIGQDTEYGISGASAESRKAREDAKSAILIAVVSIVISAILGVLSVAAEIGYLQVANDPEQVVSSFNEDDIISAVEGVVLPLETERAGDLATWELELARISNSNQEVVSTNESLVSYNRNLEATNQSMMAHATQFSNDVLVVTPYIASLLANNTEIALTSTQSAENIVLATSEERFANLQEDATRESEKLAEAQAQVIEIAVTATAQFVNITATAINTCQYQLQAGILNLDIRSGAGDKFDNPYQLEQGHSFIVEARDYADEWLYGHRADDFHIRGWIKRVNVEPIGGRCFNILVDMQARPTATATPER